MIRRAAVLLLLLGLGVVFVKLLLDHVPATELGLVATYYAVLGAEETGATNLITAILVTYRGLDTLGEVTVLFLAAAIVGLVLARGRSDGVAGETREMEAAPPVGELLETGRDLLVPLILLLGVYVIANGHLTPGGGFQGGAILASAILLVLLTDPVRRFSHRFIAVLESVSGLVFVGLGVLGIFLAGGFLDNRILPLGTLGEIFSAGAIPIIYAFVGLKVGAEFSSMLVSLSEAKAEPEAQTKESES
jgi:multicomponent Na+:H+ antiporter subunit B